MSADVLEQIVATTREAVSDRKAALPAADLPERDGPLRPFRANLAAPGLSLIAEHKRSSPSAGVIRADLELADVVRAYELAGARALSVLTEETRFAGRLQDITAARAAASLPILRKDFTVDEYQLHEAHSVGADAVLLIVAALDQNELAYLHQVAAELGLAALVEVHNGQELEVAVQLGADIIGITNRNLATLEVDLQTTYDLLPQVPANAVKIAESGFRTRQQLQDLQRAGLDGVLIGEALMRAADIESATRELLGSSA